ncbi:hypothetical protein [Paenibacillus nasutitermitis]|uniref:Uncharacterized protein n=1 Tax=Paenibacillus nasutitermitis TaxID=1652958 RepID=A0A916Z455_9BACL|nr:hypothetical protein [Paenibacillus nasutitermitis]GGD75182.1 hypothetical protein GCM10010911_36380 [Paenibacillus nasutitermitis]
MSYVLFVAGSIFEYLSCFLLMFTLFRFRFKRQIMLIIIISILMSQVSYFTRLIPEIGELSSYIQLVLFVLVLWILFRVPFYYSIVMNGAGFVSGFAVQGLVILSLWGSGVTLSNIQGNNLIILATQLLSATILIGICRLIHIKNWGFDYVPTSHRAHVKITGTNAVLLSLIVFSASAACVIAFLMRYHYKDYLIYASALFVITIPLFLYYSLRKDHDDAS